MRVIHGLDHLGPEVINALGFVPSVIGMFGGLKHRDRLFTC